MQESGGMTFWNWLALIAFIIALMSGLNAFLSLKARWLDWRGIRSKKKFDKRLKQLINQAIELAKYQENQPIFFKTLIERFLQIFLLFLLAISTFMLAFFWSTFPPTSPFWFLIKPAIGFIGFPVLFWSILRLVSLIRLVVRVNHPASFSEQLQHFLHHGLRKKFLNDAELVATLKLLRTKNLLPKELEQMLVEKQIFDSNVPPN